MRRFEFSDSKSNKFWEIKLEDGEYDAIVLACAGLERLGLERYITATLEPPRWLPASTQGTIGIQNRSGDEAVRELLDPLNHADTALRTRAERAVATALEGSCQVPLAVFAELADGQLSLSGLVGTPDGSTVLRSDSSGSAEAVDELAAAVAGDLVGQGAGDIINALR